MNENFESCIKLYTSLADQGDAHALFALGSIYFNGHGINRDVVEAYAWWDLAVAQGNKAARKNRDIVAEEMNTSQLKKAQELSKVYYKKYVK